MADGTDLAQAVGDGEEFRRAREKLAAEIRAQAVRIALQGVLEMLGKRTEAV